MRDEVVNVEQFEAWNGDEGAQWARHPERYDRAIARHHARLLDAASIGAGERVLDVGCGCGQTTRDAARRAVSGSALGVDLSAPMLATARRLASDEGVRNVAFEQGDAQVHLFASGAFDAVISRFGAMFFEDAVAAFANVGVAMRPGGRLAMVTWRDLSENEWLLAIRSALAAGRELPAPPASAPGPFGLADPLRVREVLGAAGFEHVDLVPFDEPIRFGDDPDDALAFLRGNNVVRGLLQDLDTPTAAAALERLRGALESHAGPDGVLFGTAAWLVTARTGNPT